MNQNNVHFDCVTGDLTLSEYHYLFIVTKFIHHNFISIKRKKLQKVQGGPTKVKNKIFTFMKNNFASIIFENEVSFSEKEVDPINEVIAEILGFFRDRLQELSFSQRAKLFFSLIAWESPTYFQDWITKLSIDYGAFLSKNERDKKKEREVVRSSYL